MEVSLKISGQYMAGRGGARPNSGPKHKWMLNGQPLKTYAVRVPEIITQADIARLIREKIQELETDNLNLSESEE